MLSRRRGMAFALDQKSVGGPWHGGDAFSPHRKDIVMAAKRSGTNLAQAVTKSGHEIWLAGIGAFSTARKEGSKLFDLLVEEGKARTRGLPGPSVQQLRSQATESFGKLEKVFEERLAKTLKGIGVPSARDVDQLSRRVAQLDKHVAALARSGNGAKRGKRKARR
jgi:polyhydroxyalkanoate synthesis regulator phasin